MRRENWLNDPYGNLLDFLKGAPANPEGAIGHRMDCGKGRS